MEKSGIGDWDRDSDLRDDGFRESTLGDCPGDLRIPRLGPGAENFPGHGPGLVPTPEVNY